MDSSCTLENTHKSLFNKTWQHSSNLCKKKFLSFQAGIYLAPPTGLGEKRFSEQKPDRKQMENEDGFDCPKDHVLSVKTSSELEHLHRAE